MWLQFLLLSIIALASNAAVTKGSQTFNCRPAVKNYDCIIKDAIFQTEAQANSAQFASKDYKEKSIAFRDSKLINFPNVFEKFRDLNYLAVDGSGIKNIPPNTFKNAKNLKDLYLYDNDFSKLSNNQFNGAKNLGFLSIYNSKVKTVEENAFFGLFELDELYLDGNQIEDLPSRTFSHLADLEILELQGNKLKQIKDDQFLDNRDLRELNVSRNAISKFNMVQLVKLTKMDVMDVSYNELTSIFIPRFFNIVNASNNKIETVTLEDATNFELTELVLSHNKINDLQSLDKLDNILTLDVSYNAISKLDFATFKKMKKLQTLKLDHNNLWELENSLLEKENYDLSYLDLSNNHLTYVDLELLATFPKLQTIVLKGNGLIEIVTEETVKKFSQLSVLSIEENDWDCGSLSKTMAKFGANIKYSSEGKSNCEMPNKENVKNVCCSKAPNYVKQKLVDSMKETTLLKKTVIKLGEEKNLLEKENDKFFMDLEEKVKNPKIKLSAASKKGDQVSKIRDYLAFLEDGNRKCEETVAKMEVDKQNITNKQKADENERDELKKKVKDLENASANANLMAKSLKDENERLKNQAKALSDPKNTKKWSSAIIQ